MSSNARQPFSQLLDGRTANGFDAKSWLAKRREARRQIPLTPIQRFDFPLSETMTAPIEWTGAVAPTGVGNLKL